MKGIYKRRQTFWFRFTANRKQHRVSLGTSDEIEAIEIAHKILANPLPYINGENYVTDLINQYRQHCIVEKHQTEGWAVDQGIRLTAFCRDFKIQHPTQITVPTIKQWLEPYANENTAIQQLAILSRFTRWMTANGHMMADPCLEIPRKKQVKRPRYNFLNREQARSLIETAKGDRDMSMLVFLGLQAGLRKNECLHATSDWIDLDSKLLHVKGNIDWSPKNGRDRTIPITDEFADFLSGIEIPEPYLVRPSARNVGRYRWDFRKAFNALRERAAVDCTFHDLRRSFGSLHASAGTSPYKVAKWLGHSIIVFEQHYGHLIPADDEINNAW